MVTLKTFYTIYTSARALYIPVSLHTVHQCITTYCCTLVYQYILYINVYNIYTYVLYSVITAHYNHTVSVSNSLDTKKSKLPPQSLF